MLEFEGLEVCFFQLSFFHDILTYISQYTKPATCNSSVRASFKADRVFIKFLTYNWNRQKIFVDLSVEIEDDENFFLGLLLRSEGRVTFLPQEFACS
jgi:hypothetical protein